MLKIAFTAFRALRAGINRRPYIKKQVKVVRIKV
jgi:hypothetical protein